MQQKEKWKNCEWKNDLVQQERKKNFSRSSNFTGDTGQASACNVFYVKITWQRKRFKMTKSNFNCFLLLNQIIFTFEETVLHWLISFCFTGFLNFANPQINQNIKNLTIRVNCNWFERLLWTPSLGHGLLRTRMTTDNKRIEWNKKICLFVF